jgi:hypothetical protein
MKNLILIFYYFHIRGVTTLILHRHYGETAGMLQRCEMNELGMAGI